MATSLQTSHHISQALVGVIIDVSSSMQRNWRNQDGENVPRIDAILDALGKRIIAAQHQMKNTNENIDDIELFCLGMGFKTVMHTNQKDASFQKEHYMGPNVETREVHHLVCDLLALAEIVPNKEKLEEFQEQLNQKWQQHARDILDRSIIKEDVEGTLQSYLHLKMYQTAIGKLRKDLRYRLSRIQQDKLPHIVANYVQHYVSSQEHKIGNTSFQAARQYVSDIIKSTEETFYGKTDRYIQIILKQLGSFVRLYTSSTLKALTLGFSIPELVNDLDKEKAMSLASQIQAELEMEVKKNVALIVKKHEMQLFLSKQHIGAQFDSRHVRNLTERCIKKYGWNIIRPLIEETIYKSFAENFAEQVQQNFPYWIQLASMREITRPIHQLSHLVPHIEEEYATADKIMFGGTPFAQALDKAAIRFIDGNHQEKKKTLIIISDGDFLQSSSVMQTANLLKRRGVTIISCLVANRDLLALSFKQSPKKWPPGAQQMLDVASPFTDKDPAIRWQKDRTKLTDEKLCLQINHSSLLEDVFDAIF